MSIGELLLAFETGTLGEQETLDLFQDLVDTGLAWKLQGFYGRTARDLIEAGLIEVREVRSSSWNLAARDCVECGRLFDLDDEDDAYEWNYGHDCEVSA